MHPTPRNVSVPQKNVLKGKNKNKNKNQFISTK